MLCFIIDLINVEFVGGAKRRATASIYLFYYNIFFIFLLAERAYLYTLTVLFC
jgi:hypothetical protein